MIVSVSRRTDIPAFYTEWFARRLEDGYTLIRNPYNRKQLSKVILTRDEVDCFVFWTKDPAPLINRLNILDGYNFYFQITITPYGKDIEPFVRDKDEIMQSAEKLSGIIGAERIVWRYDPILLNSIYTKEYHYAQFEKMAQRLSSAVKKCIISFIDDYKEVRRNTGILMLKTITEDDMRDIAYNLSGIAKANGIKIESCAEKIDLSGYGIGNASCVDAKLIASITGRSASAYKPGNIRAGCACVKSADIGEYNTCPHRCAYCYANYNASIIEKNRSQSDVNSPLLTGYI